MKPHVEPPSNTLASTHLDAGTATEEAIVKALDDQGFCIITGFLKSDKVSRLRRDLTAMLDTTPDGRNCFEGFKTRRAYALFGKTRECDALATDPVVLKVIERVLGVGPNFNLSSTVAIQIFPGEKAQSLHRDDGKYPIPRPHQEVVVNTMWAIDDFVGPNGATVVVPGSHLAKTDGCVSILPGIMDGNSASDIAGSSSMRALSEEASQREQKGQKSVLIRRAAGDKQSVGHPDSLSQGAFLSSQMQAVMPSGSLLVYRGSLLHGGGAHLGPPVAPAPRLGVLIEYSAGWLRPQENHVLGVPTEIARSLPKRLQELLGYNVVPPFIGYVNGRHPLRMLKSLL